MLKKRIGGTGEETQVLVQYAPGNGGRIMEESEGHLLHNLGCILHADFAETIPNDMTVFILPNLNVAAVTSRGFVSEQVKKVFVVNLDEGTLETKVPSTSSFLAELPGT